MPMPMSTRIHTVTANDIYLHTQIYPLTDTQVNAHAHKHTPTTNKPSKAKHAKPSQASTHTHMFAHTCMHACKTRQDKTRQDRTRQDRKDNSADKTDRTSKTSRTDKTDRTDRHTQLCVVPYFDLPHLTLHDITVHVMSYINVS